MSLSPIGKRRFQAYAVLMVINTIVLGLSGHINHFQNFYYHADIIPFALSLSTMIFLFILGFLELKTENAFTAKPPFEIGWLGLFSLLWLAFNSFSTNRWQFVSNGLCGTIPDEPLYGSYKTWCNEIQALRVFIWLEWVIFFLMFVFIFRWAFNQDRAGREDVWTTVISRFHNTIPSTPVANLSRAPSEFLQWEKFASQAQDNSASQEYQEPAANYNVHTQTQSTFRAQYPSMQYMQDFSNPGYRLPKIHQYYNEQNGALSNDAQFPQAV